MLTYCLLCPGWQVMLHTSAPFQAGELQAQQDELSRKLEGKKAEEARCALIGVRSLVL